MSHEIFIKYFIECLFFCSTHGFNIELYDIFYSILCTLYILRNGVLDWHIHCERVWYEIIKIVEHSLDFHVGSCKRFNEVQNVSGIFFFFFERYRICSEILKSALFPSFGKMYSFFKELFRLLNCLHIFADFVLFLALVDDTPWWKISIK